MIKDIYPFKFWCQKVLPLVYDDSLSYYECLSKLKYKINELITNVNNVAAILNMINTVKIPTNMWGRVRYYYVDAQNGDDANDGLTEASPFKTINRLLDEFNNGYNNIGGYFMTSGIYTISTNRNIVGCALHLKNYKDSDVVINSDEPSLVLYASHLNTSGSEGHPLTLDLPVFRLDGGEFWADYTKFMYQFSANGCGIRHSNCIYDKYIYVSHGNAYIENPTINNANNYDRCMFFQACTAYVTGNIRIAEPAQTTPNNSRIIQASGAFVGVQNIQINNTLTHKYNYVARCYGGAICASNADKNKLLQLADNAVLNTGEIWVNE